jgi:acetyl esterase/lipase
MCETIGQRGLFHNKQIAAAVVWPDLMLRAMTENVNRVVPIGEERDREMLKGASTYTYRERPQGEIQAHLFLPKKSSGKPRTLVVFFHGGFWESPSPAQFVPHCLHLADRGAVTVVAETRTASRHGTGALEAIEDARDLIRWLRHNAATFEIDPERVVVCGAAGGALLALMTTLPKEQDLAPVDGLDCRAQALILFSALVDAGAGSAAFSKFPDELSAKKNSPLRLLRRHLPPMIFFHGKADRIAPFAKVASFCRKARWRGNSCELVDYEKAEHGFFNFNLSHHNFELTIGAADRFLVERGLLEAAEDDVPAIY